MLVVPTLDTQTNQLTPQYTPLCLLLLSNDVINQVAVRPHTLNAVSVKNRRRVKQERKLRRREQLLFTKESIRKVYQDYFPASRHDSTIRQPKMNSSELLQPTHTKFNQNNINNLAKAKQFYEPERPALFPEYLNLDPAAVAMTK